MLEKQQEQSVNDFLDNLEKANDAEEVMGLGRHFLSYAQSNQTWFIDNCFSSYRRKRDKIKGSRPQRTYVAIDAMNVIHRSWCRKTSDKAQAFVDIINEIKSTFKNLPVILVDDSGTTFRDEIFKEWKGDRPPKSQEFLDYVEACRDKAWEIGLVPLSWPDFESDDVLASIAATAGLWEDKVVLCTNDRDMWQCLGPFSAMYHVSTGHFTAKDLEKNHKIKPNQAVDWMCLVGKNGIPGCKGIGETFASNLLSKYGTFQELYHHRDDEKRFKESLEEFLPRYPDLRRAHTLWKSIPIKMAMLEELK